MNNWDELWDRIKKAMEDPESLFKEMGIDEEDFMRIVEEMEKVIEELMKTSFNNMEPGRFLTKGFSIRIDSNGKPRIETFGNKTGDQSGKEPTVSFIEPLADVIEKENEITITVEIPGVERKDINLRTTKRMIEIDVSSKNRKYHKVIDLPSEIVPNSTKATYKNGVLDIVLKKRVSPNNRV
jgi:HSP20 family protein